MTKFPKLANCVLNTLDYSAVFRCAPKRRVKLQVTNMFLPPWPQPDLTANPPLDKTLPNLNWPSKYSGRAVLKMKVFLTSGAG